jgi:hypothetical protein
MHSHVEKDWQLEQSTAAPQPSHAIRKRRRLNTSFTPIPQAIRITPDGSINSVISHHTITRHKPLPSPMR